MSKPGLPEISPFPLSSALKSRLLVCCMAFIGPLSAQNVSTILSKDKIVIGEQALLRIKVDNIPAEGVRSDFVFPDTVNHIEILYDSVESTGPLLIHNLTITSFDTGSWQIPSFKLELSNGRVLQSEPLVLTVLPVDVSDMADYHDIKDILEETVTNNWWLVAAVVALALISLFGFLWFVNRKKAPASAVATQPDLDAVYRHTLQQVKDASTFAVSDREQALQVYAMLSFSLRSFLDLAYRQRTHNLTTGEYMIRMKGRLADSESERKYFQFLRLSDAVKFAKYLPPADDTSALLPDLEQVINSVYQQAKTPG
ncbi:MAG TPA: hypothetical protein VF145_14220 [Chitinophagaceae bacterium]